MATHFTSSTYRNRHLNLEESRMLTVPRSQWPETRTQSVSNHSETEQALLHREQQIWIMNWVQHSSLLSVTPTDLRGNTLLKSFITFFFSSSPCPILLPENKPVVQGLATPCTLRPPTLGDKAISAFTMNCICLAVPESSPYTEKLGGGGSIPVKDNLAGEELRTINKNHLARPWTFLLSYELSSQSENVAAAAVFFFNFYDSCLYSTT